jgi:hypothetical protein
VLLELIVCCVVKREDAEKVLSAHLDDVNARIVALNSGGVDSREGSLQDGLPDALAVLEAYATIVQSLLTGGGREHQFGVLSKTDQRTQVVDEAVLALADTTSDIPVLCDLALFSSGQVSKAACVSLGRQSPNQVIAELLSLALAIGFETRLDKSNVVESKKAFLDCLRKASKEVDHKALKVSVVIDRIAALIAKGEGKIAQSALVILFPVKRLSALTKSDEVPNERSILEIVGEFRSGTVSLRKPKGIILSLTTLCDESEEIDELWRELKVSELILLQELPEIRKFLKSDKFRDHLHQRLYGEISKAKPFEAVALMKIFSQFSVDDFPDLFKEKLSSNSSESRMLRELARLVMAEDLSSRTREIEQFANESISQATTLKDEAVRQAALLRQQVQDLDERLKVLRSDKAGLRDYEAKQAQADALKEIIEVIERLNVWVGTRQVEGSVISELVVTLGTRLERFDIEAVGVVGEILTRDHNIFDFDDNYVSGPFLVVQPAYRVKSLSDSILKRGIGKPAK